jgi:hypothetical protein
LNRQPDRLGYETLGNLVKDLMLGKITNLTEEKQIEAMKINLQSSGQNIAQLGGHYDFYKNIDVEDMLKEYMKRYHPKAVDVLSVISEGNQISFLELIMDLTIDKKSC